MSKTIHLTYCGIDGEGETVKTAKQDAARRLEQLVGRSREGCITVNVLGHVALVMPTTYGYSWAFLTDENGEFHVRDSQPGGIKHIYGNGGYADRDDAIRSAVIGLAQTAWRPGEDYAEVIHAASLCLPQRDQNRVRSELHSWVQWQIRYRAFRDRGMTDVEAHAAASDSRHLLDGVVEGRAR